MYRNDSLTLKFPAFGLPFGGYLDPNNRWVRKSVMIHWAIGEWPGQVPAFVPEPLFSSKCRHRAALSLLTLS